VEFKEFGISLAFTPTVLDDGLINIVVQPEVSRIDRTNSVTVSGFNIPGLTTRRAKTTVELRDGEGFAIAGLIQSDFQDTVRQFPVLGDVPVLGALMRSSDFQRNESELVIIVTPHLVKPAPAEALSTPADNFVPPSEVDIWLLGRTEGPGSGLTPSGAAALGAQGAGGIVGRYGHIVK
jgi:pilus assembly protein CpaC